MRFEVARAAALLAGLFVAIGTSASSSSAHPLSPSLLRIREVAPGHAEVSWKTPRATLPGGRPEPVLPPHCTAVTAPTLEVQGTASVFRWQIDCGAAGLTGATIGADGLDVSATDAIVHLELADGRSQRMVLTAAQPRWQVPEVQGAWDVFVSYLRLGFDHILSGFDHLVFVLALMLLVAVRRLVPVLTAFTLGHSITLALSVLDLVRVAQRPVEILIALSIAIVAWEVLRAADGQRTNRTRLPVLMAATFGLLHGLGFAGALREVGLPHGAIPLSLFAFNVGIELGQLAFVAVMLVPAALLGMSVATARRVQVAGAYAIGALAFFWVFDRVFV